MSEETTKRPAEPSTSSTTAFSLFSNGTSPLFAGARTGDLSKEKIYKDELLLDLLFSMIAELSKLVDCTDNYEVKLTKQKIIGTYFEKVLKEIPVWSLTAMTVNKPALDILHIDEKMFETIRKLLENLKESMKQIIDQHLSDESIERVFLESTESTELAKKELVLLKSALHSLNTLTMVEFERYIVGKEIALKKRPIFF